jgi:hypothetical protein
MDKMGFAEKNNPKSTWYKKHHPIIEKAEEFNSVANTYQPKPKHWWQRIFRKGVK